MRVLNITKTLQVLLIVLLISITKIYAKDQIPKVSSKQNRILAQLDKDYAYEAKMVNRLPQAAKDEKYLNLIIKFSSKDDKTTDVNISLKAKKSDLSIDGNLKNYSLDTHNVSKLSNQKMFMKNNGIIRGCNMNASILFENKKVTSFLQNRVLAVSNSLDNFIPSVLFKSDDCDFELYSTATKPTDFNGPVNGMKWWAWLLIVIGIIVF